MKTVAVIFGGRSAEHDVSIITALRCVIKPLQLSREYQVEAVYIAKNGAWFWDDKLKDISLYTSGAIEQFMAKATPATVLFDGGFTLVKSGLGNRKTKVDVVFPAMHGTYGEDGALMGLLDMAGVPYVGCGQAASVVAMDKALAKQVVMAHGLPTPKAVFLQAADLQNFEPGRLAERTKGLRYPLFVKPAHLGSSIGISRVAKPDELANAVEVAAHYDNKVVVEEAVPNLIEVTLPIMGNDTVQPALLEQPQTKAEDFFDFDTKYLGQGGKKTGGAKAGKQGAQGYSIVPADIPKALYAKAEQLGLDVYRALECSGLARVDMLIDSKSGQVFFNEVNPLPGSLYAHNWAKAGVSNVELVSKLIGLAEERASVRQKLNTVFSTNFLQQFQ